jgi:hypothetical protein
VNSTPPAVRRQHFVPSGYLQFFAAPPHERNSLLLCWEGGVVRESTPGSECFSNNFYASGPASGITEAVFREVMEDDYPPLIRSIKSGRTPTGQEKRFLLRFMLGMYARNLWHIHEDGTSRYDGVQDLMGNLMLANYRHNFGRDASIETVWPFIEDVFRVKVMRTTQGWLTSDNPCIGFTAAGVVGTAFVLPLTPRHLAVAWNSRIIKCHGLPSDEDWRQILAQLREHRNRSLFMPGRPGAELPTLGPPDSGLPRGHITSKQLFVSMSALEGSLSCLRVR